MYHFGHGLSYTSFDYSDVTLSNDSLSVGSSIEASIELTNTGNYDGAEIVQMYISDHFASVTLPNIELKGFSKVFLKKGETKKVTFQSENESLYDVNDESSSAYE